MGAFFIIQIVLLIATTVLSAYLASRNGPRPTLLGDFQVPTAEEGRVIPVVFGTVKLAGPNVVWYGNLKIVPIHSEMNFFLGGFIGQILSKHTVGYKYYLGMDLMLCHGPVDGLAVLNVVSGLVSKCVGDGTIVVGMTNPLSDIIQVVCSAIDATHFAVTKQGLADTAPDPVGTATVGVLFTTGFVSFQISEGPTTPFQIGDYFAFTIAVPSALFAEDRAVPYTMGTQTADLDSFYMTGTNLFGGEKQLGGLVGPVVFYHGTATQPSDPYLSTQLPGANPAPAYAGYCHAVFQQVYVGTGNTINPIAIVVRRCPDPLALGAGNANINGDANPAWMIWDLMTSTAYGLGIPPSRFDPVSFTAASVTLLSEGLGMSMQIDNPATADATVTEILRHISGCLFTDPATGLWTLKLIRADYDPTTLVELGDADLLSPPEFSRLTWDETLNEIKIKYCDRSLYFTVRLAQAQETANYAARGQLASDPQEFFGLSNFGIAQFVAQRELQARSYPIGRAKLMTTRKAWNFRIGQVFAFSNSALGFVRVPYRVATINYGDLLKGDIEINAVEDVFALSYIPYTPPLSVGGWGNPIPVGPPPAPIAQDLMEAPYALAGSPQRFVAMFVARGDGLSVDCDIDSSTSGPLALTNQDQSFIPLGFLASLYPAKAGPEDSVGFILTAAGVDLDTLESGPLNLFLIDGEIMSFSTVTPNIDGTFTIAGILRGLFDTVPSDHASGASVWFFGESIALVQPSPYSADVTVTAKALPSNMSGGTTPAVQVPTVSLTTASRAQKPNPPGDVLVNGVWFPASIFGNANVSWVDRNRVAQGQSIVRQDDPSIPGGIEGTYTLVVVINGVTVVNLAGQVGNAYAFTTAARIAAGAGSFPVVFSITPVNGSLVGKTRTLTFFMTGFGMGFGMYFGGLQI